MLRGGSWNNNERATRCAYRNRNTPTNINDNNGFRCVVSCLPALPGRNAPSSRAGGPEYGEPRLGSRSAATPIEELRNAPSKSGRFRTALPLVVGSLLSKLGAGAPLKIVESYELKVQSLRIR